MSKVKTSKKTSRKSVTKKKVTKKSSTKAVTKKKNRYINADGSLRLDVPNGSKFTGTITGEYAEGHIYKCNDEKWFLCQNTHDGAAAPAKLGYSCSWYFNPEMPGASRVHIYSITPDPKMKVKIPKLPPMIDSYTPEIHKGYIQVGCHTIPNTTVREMVKWLKD